MTWQPIETAPSGTFVWIWVNGEIRIASNSRDEDGDFWRSGSDKDGWSDQLFPTHWMPLPEPPK